MYSQGFLWLGEVQFREKWRKGVAVNMGEKKNFLIVQDTGKFLNR